MLSYPPGRKCCKNYVGNIFWCCQRECAQMSVTVPLRRPNDCGVFSVLPASLFRWLLPCVELSGLCKRGFHGECFRVIVS